MLSAFPALAPQHHGAHTMLTGLLDRLALYGVLAEIEALGPPRTVNHRNQVTAAHRAGRYRRARPFRYEKLPLHD